MDKIVHVKGPVSELGRVHIYTRSLNQRRTNLVLSQLFLYQNEVDHIDIINSRGNQKPEDHLWIIRVTCNESVQFKTINYLLRYGFVMTEVD